ncbi:hypothetical protein CHLNCDRAFT_52395 [Chlorella variabilis]|uniref:Dynein axonemal assembly factor 11-like CS domain-containing protein n=1 Tax=Chlorella variabilis TaxID=554065 RepID=E1ZEY4_CHLVA|nr:hypothetical protein CHLNCDRAFT_52395 [Chlorella variabilis]EFN55740.1 hypothetical protein CHLNCDRAFT_52395 [Chlorella variabilis]|eukprot:XP_005847842.1 hypothetical protein CHLNCDRAFT_52395 [Chlorella variabilis]
MTRITQALLVKRAEHNDGILRTLEEIALHAQGIERIELLNQCCRHLRILYLQNNIIPKIEQLHRLKELEQLNLALNNIRRVQNLQRCESLQRLDLTANFVDKAGLLSLSSLRENERLQELSLLGNPCTKWPGYRAYVVGTLPRLQSLDGEQVLPSERIAAAQQLPALEARLRAELLAEGVDPEQAAQVEDDSLLDAQHIPETGVVGQDGQLRRPWCPATRVLEQREAEAQARAAEEARQADRARSAGLFGEPQAEPPLRERLPEIVEGQPVYQKNEGKWEYRLEEGSGGSCLDLDVALGRYLDTSAIQADVQPGYVQLLAKGRLLQLELPAEVRPDAAVARRSKTTGNLLITMPLADAQGCLRPAAAAAGPAAEAGVENAAGACNRPGRGRGGGNGKAAAAEAELPAAVLSAVEGEGDDCQDSLPPL